MEIRFPDSSFTLLPPNASALERDVLRLPQIDGLLQPQGNTLPLADVVTLPDSWLPWLMIEYGLAELHPFFTDPRELIREGVQFWRVRGTEAGMNTVFRWLHRPHASVWERQEPGIHYAEWQVNLGERAGPLSNLCPLIRLGNLAQPAHARFRRVFNDAWNDHVFGWDDRLSGSTGLLSDYSGVVTTQGAVCGQPGGEVFVVSLGGIEGAHVTETVGIRTDHVSDRISSVWVNSYSLWPRLSEDWAAPGAFYPDTARATVGVEREHGAITRDSGQWAVALLESGTGWPGLGRGGVLTGMLRESV